MKLIFDEKKMIHQINDVSFSFFISLLFFQKNKRRH